MKSIIIATGMFVFAVATPAQMQTGKCRGPIYEVAHVSKRAQLSGQPDFHILDQVLDAGAAAHVVLEAVLCRSGRVTDIKVKTSEPPRAAEWVVGALSLVTFTPAELNWHTVSQRQQFDFTFKAPGVSGISDVRALGRLTEEIDVIGNRRLTKEEIFAWVKTRPGDPYNPDQVRQDLQALLKTGNFNALATRVTAEDAARGGVRVIFYVFELPLITEISFESPLRNDQPVLVAGLAKQRVDMRSGRPFDQANVQKAMKVIEEYFRSLGWINVKAEASVENLTPTEVKIVFKITGTNF